MKPRRRKYPSMRRSEFLRFPKAAKTNIQTEMEERNPNVYALRLKRFRRRVRVTMEGLCSTVKKVQEKGAGDNGRSVSRRQSARFKHDEPQRTCSIQTRLMIKCKGMILPFLLKRKMIRYQIKLVKKVHSISSLSREVTKKVQSYKEIGVNVKMCRPE
ncbi:hypothetical protein HanLR1_Chr03g0088821 [Helianthus annuus]|nr:hypothetical protein HanLR1_Chr03g0088821 [Helianthus annuus]